MADLISEAFFSEKPSESSRTRFGEDAESIPGVCLSLGRWAEMRNAQYFESNDLFFRSPVPFSDFRQTPFMWIFGAFLVS